MRTIIGWFAAFLMVASIATHASAQTPVRVVVSFSILADLVKQVGGDDVAITALVGANADLHTFQPSPADSKRLTNAHLVVINGLGLEGWADRLVKASGYRGTRLVASKGIKALPAAHRHAGHGDGRRYDPHAWQEVANVKVYVTNIRDSLIAVDPARGADYERRAREYLQQLNSLEQQIKQTFNDLPKPRRAITSHEAFTYYGDAYEIEFLAPQGVGGDTEPSARSVAELIRQIKRENVKAIFVENMSRQRIMDQISKETGAVVGGTLYSDALSEESGPAPTYLDMMRHNTRLIAAALRGQVLP